MAKRKGSRGVVNNADEKNTKVRLAVAINRIFEEAELSQAAAAERLEGFSVERMLNFLKLLGRDIEIVIRRPRPGRSPKIQVTAA